MYELVLNTRTTVAAARSVVPARNVGPAAHEDSIHPWVARKAQLNSFLHTEI